MTAPTYRDRIVYGLTSDGGRLGHRTWEVTDGIGGPLLLSGWALTRAAAERAAADAAATCVPWTPQCDLDAIVERLHAEGLDVEAHYDDQSRVRVRPLCACSTWDEVRVLRAFLALTSAVRWEVASR